jgi:hypothetical protein
VNEIEDEVEDEAENKDIVLSVDLFKGGRAG